MIPDRSGNWQRKSEDFESLVGAFILDRQFFSFGFGDEFVQSGGECFLSLNNLFKPITSFFNHKSLLAQFLSGRCKVGCLHYFKFFHQDGKFALFHGIELPIRLSEFIESYSFCVIPHKKCLLKFQLGFFF